MKLHLSDLYFDVPIIVPTIWKIWSNFVFGYDLYHVKTCTANNHRDGPSDISYERAFSHFFKKIFSVLRKTGINFFVLVQFRASKAIELSSLYMNNVDLG